ncbi:MAG TPA: DNA-directed RNA polymerase subunit beta [Candidatus Peribacterales bacterium]|nr:DNA-directed RNA polymerase subunit beta [Candidatus Peribacterales bacterium]
MASKKPKKKIIKKTVIKKKAGKTLPAKKAAPSKEGKSSSGEQKLKAKNIPRQRTVSVYKFKEDKAIVPTEELLLPSLRGTAPAVFKDLAAHLQPTKVVDNRVYLTDDPSDDSELPPLISVQLQSYRWLLGEGISELLQEISPITDFSGRKMEVHFLGHTYDPPKYDAETCRRNNLSFEAALKAQTQLINKETGEIKEQDVFLGSIPLMTSNGTFIINGIERVVVNQLVRSPGVFFRQMPENPHYHGAKIIPKRGVWLEVETDRKGIITCKIDRKRKIPVTQILRIFGYETDEEIMKIFEDIADSENDFIKMTLEKDSVQTVEDAYQSVYRKIRPGDLATPDNAKQLIDGLFFDFKKYDMGQIARYKMNRRFNLDTPNDERYRVFQVRDWVEILRELVKLNNGQGLADDIDHLSNRRVRSVGELVQNKFRVGLVRTERITKDRMTVMDLETVTPMQLINCRPITAAMREFFASSPLSQFMDQTNPLSELAHKRRLSAMGPGGLSRERASFDVRDVHTSHYGRICPIATPEGPNIGLVVHLASYARVNEYGFLETPYREIAQSVKMDADALVGRIIGDSIRDGRTVLLKEGDVVTTKAVANKVVSLLKKEGKKAVPVRAYLTGKTFYVDAEQERHIITAQASSPLNEKGEFMESRVSARHAGEPLIAHVKDLTHMDVSPKQILSISTSLIPFLEHDDNTRASMGTNMLRQSVPLIHPESPLVGTGMEGVAARASGHALIAEEAGQVVIADAGEVTVIYNSGKKSRHALRTFERSNQATCFHMIPRVRAGEKVKRGQVLADGAGVENGELALGRNLLVAYMPWGGYNFEDAVILSDRIVKDGLFDSIHIENYITDMRDTKLGPETITRDIPNVGEAKLKDLDQDGIVRLGATVHEGDILVGKITPKGETELTPEERLLQAIFGDKAKDVKDSSLRLPGGEGGKVVGIQIFDRSEGMELPTGVIRQVKVYVAQTRKIQVGDKMAGRHGNKGVVSRIVPQEDMPFLADGTPVDIILNPLGVTSRMNIGQILETHLGWAAKELGVKFATPALNGISTQQIEEFLEVANLPRKGKVQLYDGRTGEPFDHETTVGIVYMLKLLHLVEDKIHARSVGPYSLVTQQPLGGKAQHGGQRFGEMEVWALEAYGAAHTLQEMLTIKSDDVIGRSRAYEALVKGEPIKKPSTPESFNVLLQELRALGLKPELLKFKEELKLEERAVIEVGEVEVVELKTEADEEELLISVPAEDKVMELEELSDESDDEVRAGVETGDPGDATGESMEAELKEHVVSEEAQEAA